MPADLLSAPPSFLPTCSLSVSIFTARRAAPHQSEALSLCAGDNWLADCHTLSIMRYRLGSFVLASGHPKSGHPVLLPWELVIATGVSIGLVALFVLTWALRLHHTPRKSKYPGWMWLGWGLVVVFCVDLSLWVYHFSGVLGLGIVVGALSTAVPTLFTLWFQQVGKKISAGTEQDTTLPQTGAGAADKGTNQLEAKQKVAVLMPKTLRDRADIDRAALADAQQKAQILRAKVTMLRKRILKAVMAYGPEEDWRLLLAGPRRQLGSCSAELDQFGQVANGWAQTGKWSFEFRDTLVAAKSAVSDVSDAIEERTAGRPPIINLGEAATRLDGLVRHLADLLETAMPDP